MRKLHITLALAAGLLLAGCSSKSTSSVAQAPRGDRSTRSEHSTTNSADSTRGAAAIPAATEAETGESPARLTDDHPPSTGDEQLAAPTSPSRSRWVPPDEPSAPASTELTPSDTSPAESTPSEPTEPTELTPPASGFPANELRPGRASQSSPALERTPTEEPDQPTEPGPRDDSGSPSGPTTTKTTPNDEPQPAEDPAMESPANEPPAGQESPTVEPQNEPAPPTRINRLLDLPLPRSTPAAEPPTANGRPDLNSASRNPLREGAAGSAARRLNPLRNGSLGSSFAPSGPDAEAPRDTLPESRIRPWRGRVNPGPSTAATSAPARTTSPPPPPPRIPAGSAPPAPRPAASVAKTPATYEPSGGAAPPSLVPPPPAPVPAFRVLSSPTRSTPPAAREIPGSGSAAVGESPLPEMVPVPTESTPSEPTPTEPGNPESVGPESTEPEPTQPEPSESEPRVGAAAPAAEEPTGEPTGEMNAEGPEGAPAESTPPAEFAPSTEAASTDEGAMPAESAPPAGAEAPSGETEGADAERSVEGLLSNEPAESRPVPPKRTKRSSDDDDRPLAAAPAPASAAAPNNDPFKVVRVFYGTDRRAVNERTAAAESTRHRLLMVLGVVLAAMAVLSAVLFNAWRKLWVSVATAMVVVTGVLALMRPASVRQSIAGDGAVQVVYGNDRGDFQVGECEVTIPKIHREGQLESPSLWKLQVSSRADKHIILRSVERKSPDEFYQAVRDRVQQSSRKELFVFIHGYNVSFETAVRRTAQMSNDLGFEGAPICYSWPSAGGLLRYTVDETNVLWTAPHLRKFLRDLVDDTGAESINVIAHSMGNRALSAAMAGMASEVDGAPKKFQQLILAAPDIDAEVFRRDIAPVLSRAAQRVTLYASSHDQALRASKVVHGYSRAGDSGNDVIVVPGIETIDASQADISILGHSYYGNSQAIVNDLEALITGNRAAPQRPWLQPLERDGQTYWMIDAPAAVARAPHRALK